MISVAESSQIPSVNMPTNQLTPIARSDLTKLRDLYLADWPNNCVGYYTLNNFIQWLDKDPQIEDLSVLTLNDNWSDGTFVIIDRYQLFINSLASSNDRLIIALSLLDWSHGYKVTSFLERHRPAVLSTVESKRLELEYDCPTFIYHMSHDDAIQIENICPDGMVLKELGGEHAEEVENVWPNRHQGSLFLFRRLIRWNLNVGLFSKDTDELIAWCLVAQNGFLGSFQVKDGYQGRKLGGVVLKAISKMHAEHGEDVIAAVSKENVPSMKVFTRCGFRIIDNAYYLRTTPTVDFTWPDDK